MMVKPKKYCLNCSSSLPADSDDYCSTCKDNFALMHMEALNLKFKRQMDEALCDLPGPDEDEEIEDETFNDEE